MKTILSPNPQMSKPLKKLILIFFLTIVCAIISMPKEINLGLQIGGIKIDKIKRPAINIQSGRINIQKDFELKLGLDLAGGSHLVFETDLSKVPDESKKDALTAVKEVIERRVNLFGVSEPNVQTSSFEGKDRVIVELPEIGRAHV